MNLWLEATAYPDCPLSIPVKNGLQSARNQSTRGLFELAVSLAVLVTADHHSAFSTANNTLNELSTAD